MTDVPPLDEQLCFTLYATSMAIGRMYKPLLDRVGLTYPQYLVLLALWEEEPRTIGGVAQRLSLESSTVTPLVKRLEAAGFVTRMRSVLDERQVHVRLTAQGREIREQCKCLPETLIQRSGVDLQRLSEINRDVQQLWRALREPDVANNY